MICDVRKKNEMKSKLPGIAVAVALFFALAAIAFALVYQKVAGVLVYDFNFQAFHDTLTSEQRDGIIRTVRSIIGLYITMLAVTNGVWLAVGWFLLSRLQKRGPESPNQTLHATAATPSS